MYYKTTKIIHDNKEHVLIVNVQEGIEMIDPFTEFIYYWYSHRSAGHRKNVANRICTYLNWCQEGGLPNPARAHIEDVEGFLFDKADEGVSEEYLKHLHSVISQFYLFLIKKKNETAITLKDYDNRGLLDIRLPDTEKKNSHKINDLEPEYVPLFMEAAIRYQPRIAFGVFLSFSSGLRGAELTNLSKHDITCIGPYGRDGMILDVKKRALRDDKGTGGVKKTRVQKTEALGKLGARLYEIHLKRFTSDCSAALFVNDDGKAMTVSEYQRRFRLVKKHFIEMLKQSDNREAVSYAMELEHSRWNTHIARGYYTNRVADETDNPLIISAKRGDSKPESALDYMQQHAADSLTSLNQILTDKALEGIDV